MNYSSVLSNDHLPVASNFRALLNLKDLLDSPVLSSTHSVSGLLESYELTLVDKRVVAEWVRSYQANIGQTVQLNVAAVHLLRVRPPALGEQLAARLSSRAAKPPTKSKAAT